MAEYAAAATSKFEGRPTTIGVAVAALERTKADVQSYARNHELLSHHLRTMGA